MSALNTMIIVPKYDGEETVGVMMFTLLQWRSAMKLEAKGMKMSRRSVTQHVRDTLGTPKRFNRDKLIRYIEAVIEDANEQLGVTA